MQKKAEMQKNNRKWMFNFEKQTKKKQKCNKGKCMFNLKIHAKKAKMHFQFRNSYKKGKNEKRKTGCFFLF